MSEEQIRQLEIKDYDALIELWQRAGLTTLRPQGRDSREAFARLLDPGPDGRIRLGAPTVLALDKEDHLIGVVIATHDGRKGWINRLAIHPKHRRQGHARRLIAAAEQVLRDQGIQVIGALVERENAASLALFQRVGYQLSRDVYYLSKRESANA